MSLFANMPEAKARSGRGYFGPGIHRVQIERMQYKEARKGGYYPADCFNDKKN